MRLAFNLGKSMKRSLIFVLLIGIGLSSYCISDIHSPPGKQQTAWRKLGRAIGNLVYGVTEIPSNMVKINNTDGNSAAWSYGVVEGVKRTTVRFGYGLYEFVTFPFPTRYGTYQQPYKSIDVDIHHGYEEFPPELGWSSSVDYCN